MNNCDLIDQHALHQPDVDAIIDGDRVISFREFGRLVRKTAAHLIDLGVKPGDRVGVGLKDNADHVIALFAVMRMGGVVLPVDWRGKSDEKAKLVTTFEPSTVLLEDGASAIPGTSCVALNAAWHDGVAAADGNREFPHDGDAPAIISLSSGTTGVPKGVVMTHARDFARMVAYWYALDLERNERHLSFLPLSFSAGRGSCIRFMLRGNTNILYPPLFRPEELVEAVAEYRATIITAVPTLLRRLLELPEQPEPLFPGLRRICTGGAVMHAEEKLEVMRRLSPNYYEVYAATGGGLIACLTPDEVVTKGGSVGRPGHLTEVQIVDENDAPVPAGEVGRLRCRGPAMAAGFFRNSEDPSGNEMFRDGWCYTGEVAAMDDDGFIFLKGRMSEVIIRGGVNIDPGEIERVLQSHPAVGDAAVVGKPSADLGEEIVAFVVPRSDVQIGDLSAHCRNQLSTYKVPQEIILVDGLPRNTAGKVRKGNLVERLEQQLD